MNSGKLLSIGVCGCTASAICCFTPAAVIGLTTLGLSAWVGWLDYVLLPAMALFLGMIVYSLRMRMKT